MLICVFQLLHSLSQIFTVSVFLLIVCLFPPPHPPLLFSMFSPLILLFYHCYVVSCQPVSWLNLPVASALRNSACRLVVTLAYTHHTEMMKAVGKFVIVKLLSEVTVQVLMVLEQVRNCHRVFFLFFRSSFVSFVWFFLLSPVSPYLEVFPWIKRRSWLLVCRLY